MHNHSKMMWPLALLAIAAACPIAAAQDAAEAKTKPGTPTRPGGAASSSYAACAPGNPIGGIIVKGGQNPKGPKGRTVEACPDPDAESVGEQGVRSDSTQAQPQAAALRDTRTYTGGRRNDDAPSAAEAAPGQPIKGVIVKGGGPNKPASLSVAPTTIKAVAPAAAQLKNESGE